MRSSIRILLTFLAALPSLAGSASAEGMDWPQWGGPSRTFAASAASFAADWPSGGPTVVWRRPLGDGYSGITIVGQRVITLYRQGDEEHVVAFDSASGDTLWDVARTEPLADLRRPHEPGPYSTPLVDAGRVFAVTSGGMLMVLNAADGELLWERDLDTVGGGLYTTSPMIFEGAVLVLAAGEEPGVLALDSKDGRVLWRSEALEPAHASLQWLEVAGKRQLLFFGRSSVAGLDPMTGATEWKWGYDNSNGANILTPIVGEDGLVFLSSGPSKGSLALRVTPGEQGTSVESLWESSQMRVFYSNALRQGGTLFASSGGVGPAIMAAIDLESGDILWRNRDVGRVNLVGSGDSAIAVTEEGRLLLLALSREGLEVRASADVLSGQSWTPPSLVGDRLFLRDRKELVVLDLPLDVSDSNSER